MSTGERSGHDDRVAGFQARFCWKVLPSEVRRLKIQGRCWPFSVSMMMTLVVATRDRKPSTTRST